MPQFCFYLFDHEETNWGQVHGEVQGIFISTSTYFINVLKYKYISNYLSTTTM